MPTTRSGSRQRRLKPYVILKKNGSKPGRRVDPQKVEIGARRTRSVKTKRIQKLSCLQNIIITNCTRSVSASSSEVWFGYTEHEVEATRVELALKVFIVPNPHVYKFENTEGLVYEQKIYQKITGRLDEVDYTDGSISARNFVRLKALCNNVTYKDLFAFISGKINILEPKNVLEKNFDRNIKYNILDKEYRPGLVEIDKGHLDITPEDLAYFKSILQLGLVPSPKFQDVKREFEHLYKEFKTNLIFNVTITEAVKNSVDLQTFIDLYPFDLYESVVRKVLFQVLFSMLSMHEFDICHFDLNWKNVLVQKNEKKQTCKYRYDDFEATITTDFQVYLFDWDNSHIKNDENPRLQGNKYRKNTWEPKIDILMFVRELQTNHLHTISKFFLKDPLNNPLSKELFVGKSDTKDYESQLNRSLLYSLKKRNIKKLIEWNIEDQKYCLKSIILEHQEQANERPDFFVKVSPKR